MVWVVFGLWWVGELGGWFGLFLVFGGLVSWEGGLSCFCSLVGW